MGKRKADADAKDVKASTKKKKEDAEAPPLVLNGSAKAGENGGGSVKNKEKVLILSSRGITHRYRHLMSDLLDILPHTKKDVKLEPRDNKTVLNELAELKGCTSCIFFECRKRKDLYMWLSKTPSGPSVKFNVQAVHTMEELKLTGNHLKGARPILSFSPAFDLEPHLQLLKELFTQLFTTPQGHRKSKPFFDHVFTFTMLDGRVWFRNYQISVPDHKGKLDKAAMANTTLVEVGPRFCLNPIKIFNGSFTGAPLFENPNYVSPNVTRAEMKKAKAGKYAKKVKAKVKRKMHMAANPMEKDELADVWAS